MLLDKPKEFWLKKAAAETGYSIGAGHAMAAAISVNGEMLEWQSDTISHEQICEIAGQPLHASVTYIGPKRGDYRRNGTTYVGKVIDVEDGLYIDCVVTGSA